MSVTLSFVPIAGKLFMVCSSRGGKRKDLHGSGNDSVTCLVFSWTTGKF